MGQSNNKAQKPDRVTGRKHGWISDSQNKEKRTGVQMPGFSFGFGRNRVKRIHLKPEEAEPAGFQPETVRSQSKFSQIFLSCLSSPDDHLDVIQTEKISNTSNNKNKVTDLVDVMSENQKHKCLALYHPESTSSGFSKENHLTVLTEAEKSSAASLMMEKPEEPFRSFNDGFFLNDGWSVWSEGDDESSLLSSPGTLGHRSWERNMASEQIDKISNATYDITSMDALLDEVEEVLALKQEHSLPLDPPQNTDSGFSKQNLTVLNEAEEASSALPEKLENPSNRFNNGFLKNDCWSLMSEGTVVWSDEENEDESAALSSSGMLRDCSLGKGDMGTEQIDLNKISNATYDMKSLDALLDEVEEMLGQKEERKNLPLYHPQNTTSGFSKENKDGDKSATLSYPGKPSNRSWEKGDMATKPISNASFDTNSLDVLLDEIERMLDQDEKRKNLPLYHPQNTTSGFSKENKDGDKSAALSYPGKPSNHSWEKGDMATEPIDTISNASFDNDGLDALLDEKERMLDQEEKRKNHPLYHPQNTTSGFSKENKDGDKSATLSYPGKPSNRSWEKGDMATKPISNASFDTNSLDVLLDEIERMLDQEEKRKNLPLYHPQNTTSGFSKENKDGGDYSAALSFPGKPSNRSWEKGDMATEQTDTINKASFDTDGLDTLLDQVEGMLDQKEEVKLQVKPSRKSNIVDDEIRGTTAEILVVEVERFLKIRRTFMRRALLRMKFAQNDARQMFHCR